MRESANQLVTLERMDAGLAKPLTRIDGLSGRPDALRMEIRADMARAHLILATIVIAADALTMTVMVILPNRGAGL